MKKEYYERLLKKLERAFNRCCKKLKHETTIKLSKFEIEDLAILWKEEAINKWGRNKG